MYKNLIRCTADRGAYCKYIYIYILSFVQQPYAHCASESSVLQRNLHMRARTLLATILLPVSFAQVIIPACGQPCVNEALDMTTCPDGHYECLCADPNFITFIAQCLVSSCTSDLVTDSVAAAAALCESQTGTSNQPQLASAVQNASSAATIQASTVTSLTYYPTITATTVTNDTSIGSVSASSNTANSVPAVTAMTSSSSGTRSQGQSEYMHHLILLPASVILACTSMIFGRW